ncbi:MAG: hypothetical protein U9R57_03170 [Thermodesulfobacteriota bacterium]|nr:hypothetical protein [Thermodesulfobacteriota bacterium]
MMKTQIPELAETIDDTYRVCNPDQPLTADDKRYVDLTNPVQPETIQFTG